VSGRIVPQYILIELKFNANNTKAEKYMLVEYIKGVSKRVLHP
jgi:hypothetical protein